jgi:hypothetical protein
MEKFNFDFSKVINDFIIDNFTIDLLGLTSILNAYINNKPLHEFTINKIGFNDSPFYCDKYFYMVLSNGIEIYSLSSYDIDYYIDGFYFKNLDELFKFMG